MATSQLTATKIAAGTFKYTWSGTAPFVLVQRGNVVDGNYQTTEYISYNPDDDEEPIPLEVFDSTEDYTQAVSMLHPPYVVLQWYHVPINDGYYAIDEYISAAWTNIGNVFDFGTGYHTFKTTSLADTRYSADGTARSFRITPYDSESNAGLPIEYDIVHWPIPPAPKITWSYDDGTNTLTATARA